VDSPWMPGCRKMPRQPAKKALHGRLTADRWFDQVQPSDCAESRIGSRGSLGPISHLSPPPSPSLLALHGCPASLHVACRTPATPAAVFSLLSVSPKRALSHYSMPGRRMPCPSSGPDRHPPLPPSKTFPGFGRRITLAPRLGCRVTKMPKRVHGWARSTSPLKQPTHSQIELGSLLMLLRGTRARTRFGDLSHRARWAYGVVNFKRLVQSQSRLPGDDDQYPESAGHKRKYICC
jgi:hypothetical protein